MLVAVWLCWAHNCAKVSLRIIVESGVAAELWASAWGRSLPWQKPQQLVGIAGFKLFRKAQKNMARNFVGTKGGEVSVLFVLLLGEGRAAPCFMHDATVGVPTERTLAISIPEELEALAG